MDKKKEKSVQKSFILQAHLKATLAETQPKLLKELVNPAE